MRIESIFYPLKEKKSIQVFFLSAFVITMTYLIFSISLSVFSTRPLPKGNAIDIILFGGFKAFSSFTSSDWAILALFPVFGGLLFANYTYYKCKTSKSGQAGLIVGLLAATCPACILPVVGVSVFFTFLTKISIYIKAAALILILISTFLVANSRNKCVEI
jgi:hypothetical protein